ncbi:39S ribosomal protein L20, mitochondrial-like [Limulus polyphemus]|uniref:39S ribosomal protein L20, mitochondrial-like n=1 Tax=Limulus polyphemus TaxID=6850 RepID=A0ABM1BYU6_LIMPO|nr:39S ribosomal protein L20, mitochondrial-like [Limulus polyphemus]
MVFLSFVNCMRVKGPDKFWKRRQILKLAAHFYGRKRNCYSIAIRSVQKALQHAAYGRKVKKLERINLWKERITAACEELNIPYPLLMENLARCDIALSKKTLADLAIWEPRTFKCLTQIAAAKNQSYPPTVKAALQPPPEGVITRGML